MINSSPRGEIVLLQWVLLGMFRFTVANSLSDWGESERYVRRRLHDSAIGESGMNDRSTLLLEHHLKELKLPSFLREYGKMAAQCARGCGPPPVPAAAGGSGPPASPRSRAWTPSTSQPSYR